MWRCDGTKKIKCDVCGFRTLPLKEQIYEGREAQGLAELFATAVKTFEAMDCHRCGHQVVFGVRMPRVEREAGDAKCRN